STDAHDLLLSSSIAVFFLGVLTPQRSTLFPYTTLFRSERVEVRLAIKISKAFVLRADYCGLIAVTSIEHLPGKKRRRTRMEKPRSEEHTSELQSRGHLVCRLLLEKKKYNKISTSLVCGL